jgi:germination protein M
MMKGFKWALAAFAVIAAVALSGIALYGQRGAETSVGPSPTIRTDIYYYNKTAGRLESETRAVQNGDYKQILTNVLNELRSGARSAALLSPVPADIDITLNLYENSNLVDVVFSENYDKLDPVDELYLRASIVWTLTELDFVRDVRMFAGEKELTKQSGEAVGLLNRENVSIDAEIPPIPNHSKAFTVYFADDQGQGLVPEDCVIQINTNLTDEQYIVERVIQGPRTDGLFRVIPAETKVFDVKTNDGICYVDLSREFMSRMDGGTAAERLAVYSIVNSLTELTGVKKVQLLIEGNKVDSMDHMDISSPFERNEDIILD